jgi:hypothetical protein
VFGKPINLGIATGAGLVVLDYDPARDDVGAARSFLDSLPATRIARTGGGGEHRYFHTAGVIGNSVDKLAIGLDVRGEGGLVVAPPSIHASGRRYEWVDFGAPIADLPSWVVDRLADARGRAPRAVTAAAPLPAAREARRRAAYADGALSDASAKIRGAPEGSRNDTLNREAHAIGRLVAAGVIDEARTRAELGAAAVDTGLHSTEVDATLDSALASASKSPRGLPPASSQAGAQAAAHTTTSSGVLWTTIDATQIGQPLPPVAWLVEALGFAAGAPALVAGSQFSAKSMVMLDLVLAVASAAEWLGFRLRAGRALYVDVEAGPKSVSRRLQRLARGRGIDLVTLGDALHLASMPTPPLDGRATEDDFVRALDGFDLVVIDTLAAAARADDENAATMRRPLDRLARASMRTGTTIVLVHHAKKPDERVRASAALIRGSSAIVDASGSVLLFVGEDGGAPRVSHLKNREGGTLIRPFTVCVDDVSSDEDPKWGLRVRVQDESRATTTAVAGGNLEARILSAVAGGVSTANDLIKKLACNRKALFATVRDLEKSGRLMRDEHGRLNTGGRSR